VPATVRLPYSYQDLDSNALDRAQRQALWRAISPEGMRAEPFATPDVPFRVQVRRLDGPSGRFADVAASPIEIDHRAGPSGSDGLDLFRLVLVLSGDIAMESGRAAGKTIVRPGNISIRDFTQPAKGSWPSLRPRRMLVLQVPRSAVHRAVGAGIARLHGATLSENGLAPMLKAQFTALAEMASKLDPTAHAAALEATIDLTLSTLRVEVGTHVEHELNDAGLFNAAKTFIAQNLDSVRLTPDLIARQLGCSRAHLYRVFGQQGEGVAEHVREARLQRARALLTAAGGEQKRIGDLAYRCGFADPVHFARLFRQRFGMTPTAALHDAALNREAA
jgi:AraC-like DNA-binding protein